MARQVEFNESEWRVFVGKRPTAIHHGFADCPGASVFLCRTKYGCGRYVCACDGGGGDAVEEQLCSACWVKYQDVKFERESLKRAVRLLEGRRRALSPGRRALP